MSLVISYIFLGVLGLGFSTIPKSCENLAGQEVSDESDDTEDQDYKYHWHH